MGAARKASQQLVCSLSPLPWLRRKRSGVPGVGEDQHGAKTPRTTDHSEAAQAAQPEQQQQQQQPEGAEPAGAPTAPAVEAGEGPGPAAAVQQGEAAPEQAAQPEWPPQQQQPGVDAEHI